MTQLPLRVGYDHEKHCTANVAGGLFVVDLIRVAAKRHSFLSNSKEEVASSAFLGAMLPYHMEQSLAAEGWRPKKTEGATQEDIKKALTKNCPVILFVGTGFVGHWVVAWQNGINGFYVFSNNNSLGYDRENDGSVFVSQALLELFWKKIPPVLKPLQRFKKYRIKPRTMITPW